MNEQHSAVADRFGVLDADVAVMPRLVDDAGVFYFVFRIAQDEAVFPGVLLQPLIFLCFLEMLVELAVLVIERVEIDVDREAELMFARSGDRDDRRGGVLSVVFVLTLVYMLVDLALEVALRVFI